MQLLCWGDFNDPWGEILSSSVFVHRLPSTVNLIAEPRDFPKFAQVLLSNHSCVWASLCCVYSPWASHLWVRLGQYTLRPWLCSLGTFRSDVKDVGSFVKFINDDDLSWSFDFQTCKALKKETMKTWSRKWTTGVHRGLALSPSFAKSTQPDAMLFLGNLRLQQALLDLGGFYVKTGQVLLDAFLSLPVGLKKPLKCRCYPHASIFFRSRLELTSEIIKLPILEESNNSIQDFPYTSASFGYGGFSCIAFAMNIDVIGLLSLSVAWGTLIDFEFCRSQSKSRPAKIVLPNFDKSAGQLTSSRCSNDSKGDIWGVTWEAVTRCDNGFSNRQNYEATIGDNPFATSW